MEKELITLIEKLATELGETAEATWHILIAQAKIAAITNFIGGGIFILLAIISVWLGYWIQRNWEKDDKEKAGIGVGVFLAIILVVIAVISFILPAITATFNPEFWALQKLLEMANL